MVRILISTNPNGKFLFFPFYHTGGAEKIHLEITQAISDMKPWIIITNPSADKSLKQDFENAAQVFEIAPFVKTPNFIGNLILSILVYRINRHSMALVFGGNCLPFYEWIPRFKKKVQCIDLIHAFVHRGEIGAENVSLGVAERLIKRITINSKTKGDFEKLYEENGFSKHWNDRILVIPNSVNIPQSPVLKSNLEEPIILFVSRNSPEKRVNVVGKIAHQIKQEISCRFVLIGPNLEDGILERDKEFCEFTGNLTDPNTIEKWYQQAHFLVLCSTREGMPLVIMEAMAHSMVCISTNVGGIPTNIIDGENGFLIDLEEDEKTVNDFVNILKTIINHPKEFSRISKSSYEYAKRNFKRENFNSSWRNVLK